MYDTHNLAELIKSTAKKRGVTMKEVLSGCNISGNTMSTLYHGKAIAFDSLAKIADYLDCSVDYLLGRTSDPNAHKETRPVLQIENEPRYKVRFAGRDGSIGEKYLTKEEIDALDALPDADDL